MSASVINTNVMSLNAQRNLNKNSMSLATSIARLSSGLRVNSARDDAAGLAVGMSLESSVRSLSVQIRNYADDISAAQTLDGGEHDQNKTDAHNAEHRVGFVIYGAVIRVGDFNSAIR